MKDSLLLFLFSLLLLTATVHAVEHETEYRQGLEMFAHHQYQQAKLLWRPLAEQGDVRAQYNLALLLYKEAQQTDNTRQQREARQYLAMSRSQGLVDSYLMTMPDTIMSASSVESKKMPVEQAVWLDGQSKSSYTLQLATGKSWQSMAEMQKKLQAEASLEQPYNLYVYRVEKHEQEKIISRYVLLYGVFKSYLEAKNAIVKLPENMQKSEPWIRQFSVLQSIVKLDQEQGSKNN